jgi:hypothetical protein
MTNLTDRLEQLAESDAPPMTLDIDRAVTTGRRRRRRRREALVAGLAAVVATAVVAASTVVDQVSQPDPAAPGIEAPLVTRATFGWLPPGITRSDMEAGEQGDHVRAANEQADPGTQLWLMVGSAGDVPDVELTGEDIELVPAPPVNGRTAYWATGNKADPLNGGDANLLWQAPDDRWVKLNAYYLSFFDDPQAVLHRVASGAEVGDRAQPLPVRISGLPATYLLQDVTFHRPMRRDEGTGAWSLQLNYTVDGSIFAIFVHPAGTRRVKYGARPCRTTMAVEVCLAATEGANPKVFEPLGGVQGVLDRFVPLGMDESNWETNQTR